MALIMITITLRSSCHPDFRSLDPADTGTGHLMPGYGTNGRSLAESTGIPRESVRRKVKQLIAAGWVARHGAHLRYTVRGYHAVAPAREAMLRLYVRGVQVIEALRAGSPPGAGQPLRPPGAV